MKTLPLSLIFLVVSFACISDSFAVHQYYLEELGTLEDTDATVAFGMNDNGDVVGYCRFGPGAYDHRAFLYRNGAMEDLNIWGTGHKITNDGTIVGRNYTGGPHAMIYKDGVITDLPFESAWGVNEHHEVVGWANFYYHDGISKSLGFFTGRDINAKAAVNKLQEMKILSEATDKRWRKVFCARELLALLGEKRK